MIRVEDLHKYFGQLEVLKGITEHIANGEKVVVIGASGSGKSTFLRCLNLLEMPTKGHIYIEDEEITGNKHNVNKLRQKMGMVFQQFNLFPHYDTLGNITLAPMKLLHMPKKEAVELGKHLLEKCEYRHFLKNVLRHQRTISIKTQLAGLGANRTMLPRERRRVSLRGRMASCRKCSNY